MAGDAFEVVEAIAADRELVFRFFVVFSRFEYALKRSGYLKKQERADADWDRYAVALRGKIVAATDAEVLSSVTYLVQHPPMRQIVHQGQVIGKPTPQDASESNEQYILRLVRVVRNNLFHGGKYPEGPVSDTARNADLLEACLVVLMQCLTLSPDVAKEFMDVEAA